MVEEMMRLVCKERIRVQRRVYEMKDVERMILHFEGSEMIGKCVLRIQ